MIGGAGLENDSERQARRHADQDARIQRQARKPSANGAGDLGSINSARILNRPNSFRRHLSSRSCNGNRPTELDRLKRSSFEVPLKAPNRQPCLQIPNGMPSATPMSTRAYNGKRGNHRDLALERCDPSIGAHPRAAWSRANHRFSSRSRLLETPCPKSLLLEPCSRAPAPAGSVRPDGDVCYT